MGGLLSEDETGLDGVLPGVLHLQLGLLEEALARLRTHQVHHHLQRVRAQVHRRRVRKVLVNVL